MMKRMDGAPVTLGGRLLAACEARGWRLRIDHRGGLVVERRGRPCPALAEALGDAEAEVIGALLVRGMREDGGQRRPADPQCHPPPPPTQYAPPRGAWARAGRAMPAIAPAIACEAP